MKNNYCPTEGVNTIFLIENNFANIALSISRFQYPILGVLENLFFYIK